MLKPYDLLENLLLDIENDIKNINISVISKKYGFSQGHLSRLFRFAFKQSIAAYIRSRRLAASLNDLLKEKSNILDIALEYGFEYEQTYIRAFKREFGMTPGDLRKTGQITKIKSPMHLFSGNKLDDGVVFGPDIVMVPRFHIIGKRYRIPFENYNDIIPKVGRQFWEEERKQIKGTLNSNIYIGLTRNMNLKEKHFDYMPSIQVENLKNISHRFIGETIETSMCARFRYIGQHHYYETNRNVVSMLYNVIRNYAKSEQAKHVMLNEDFHFDMMDTRIYEKPTCQNEYYIPVYEKKKCSKMFIFNCLYALFSNRG